MDNKSYEDTERSTTNRTLTGALLSAYFMGELLLKYRLTKWTLDWKEENITRGLNKRGLLHLDVDLFLFL